MGKNLKEKKKSLEKDSHAYIYSLLEHICITAPKDNTTTSSPLSFLTPHAVSPTSFKPARRTGNKVAFSLAKRKADAWSFWLAGACTQNTLNLQRVRFP